LAVLNDVQANVLKSHGRRNSVSLFLQFDPQRKKSILDAIYQLSGQIQSAKQQLDEADLFRASGGTRRGAIVRCFFLTYAGYEALGVPEKAPAGRAFRAGMRNR